MGQTSHSPRAGTREAVVNAVCHRDYTSNACVQVMLFRDRLEIINPGSLPKGMTVEDLYRTHDSIPRNRLIARAMSWTSYVEKSGSGTGEILDLCTGHGLARPEFDPTVGFFKTIVWRNGYAGLNRGTQSRDTVVGASQGLVVGASQGLVVGASQGLVGVLRVLAATEEAISSTMIANALGRTRATSYIKRLIAALIDDKMVETTCERKRGARLQKYLLTAKGRSVLAKHMKGGA